MELYKNNAVMIHYPWLHDGVEVNREKLWSGKWGGWREIKRGCTEWSGLWENASNISGLREAQRENEELELFHIYVSLPFLFFVCGFL